MIESDYSDCIEHAGIVQKNDERSVTVKIISASACSGCHAEESCTLSGKEEKIIEVSGIYNVMPGDNVTVVMKKSMGYAALILGYILPFIVILAALVIMISFSVSEPASALASLATLAFYYIILYFFRNRIGKKFKFTLKA